MELKGANSTQIGQKQLHQSKHPILSLAIALSFLSHLPILTINLTCTTLLFNFHTSTQQPSHHVQPTLTSH